MKRDNALNFSVFMLLALAGVFLAGCETTPPVDWQARVGTYTYDQAVTNLGPPDRQAKLTDGDTVAKWITYHGGGTGLSVGLGTGYISGGGGSASAAGVGVGQSIGNNDKVLTLTFGTNNVLKAWLKNY